jgi:hypothetical protein
MSKIAKVTFSLRETDHKFNNNFVDRIYPIKLEIKDTTDTNRSASYNTSKLTVRDG